MATDPASFRARFGFAPTHRVRAPGRVNLIGEHIDYLGLGVLPMALDRSLVIDLRPREDARIRLLNQDPGFAPVDFTAGPELAPDPRGSWSNYVKGAVQAVAREHGVARGFDGLVSSNLPTASGLSSSSALACAVGLAVVRLSGVETPGSALAELMAEAERFTGTRGGGMDQAIILGARVGCATRIDFGPLGLRHLPIPGDWRFVVADTGVRAEKSGRARTEYNLRRAQCEEALDRVSTRLAQDGLVDARPHSYAELLGAVGSEGSLLVAEATLDGAELRRFRHVIGEAVRVDLACDALEQGEAEVFGSLMDGSHRSLREDFEVSCAELDELVAMARDAGALGARLTGAGFGGCIVALARSDAAGSVLSALRGARPARSGLSDSREAFTAEPAGGAELRRLP